MQYMVFYQLRLKPDRRLRQILKLPIRQRLQRKHEYMF